MLPPSQSSAAQSRAVMERKRLAIHEQAKLKAKQSAPLSGATATSTARAWNALESELALLSQEDRKVVIALFD